MITARQIEREVAGRAGGRCEYCQMHQSLQGATFHVEHIVPRSQGGGTDLGNLAWACPRCNLQKGDRVEARDPSGRDRLPAPLGRSTGSMLDCQGPLHLLEIGAMRM
jgi:5-methylcytosine-specific restriction endonuclease McrA